MLKKPNFKKNNSDTKPKSKSDISAIFIWGFIGGISYTLFCIILELVEKSILG